MEEESGGGSEMGSHEYMMKSWREEGEMGWERGNWGIGELGNLLLHSCQCHCFYLWLMSLYCTDFTHQNLQLFYVFII